MNTNETKVDVLKVIKDAAMWCASKSQHNSDLGLLEVHAAVAELIEAAREFKDKDTYESEERLEAALARIGGAA